MPTTTPATCTRYNADGARCQIPTVRLDGWCGQCDGYRRPIPEKLRESSSGSHWVWGPPERWTAAPLGLDPDEAYEVEVLENAIHYYCRIHGVTRQAAEVEIRSLLEDLITSGAATERNTSGDWRIYLERKGYGLGLTPDRGAVARYRTRHRERTWAQVKNGVRSRVAAPRKHSARGGAAWQRAALQDPALPIEVAPLALSQYARFGLGQRLTQDNIGGIVQQLAAHLRDHVLPRWEQEHGPSETLSDGGNGTWVLATDEDAPKGIVLSVRFTGA